MRVVTPLVVALFTAVVAAVYAQEDNYSKNCSCITTFMELEESLLKRHSNMDNLHQAFFPSNQQFPVAVDLVVHFSTSLRTTSSQEFCNPITRLDNNTFDYKFRWSASTVIHFVRHEVLSFFSLFVYQGIVTTAEVVIDPICRGKKTKPEQLLNSLCIQLESYALNRAAKVDKALIGYCLYYKYHTDLKILGLSTEDVGLLQQVFFVTAVIFLCLIIAIRIPAALYVVPVTGKSLTTPPKSGDNSTSVNEVDSRGFEASTIIDNLGKQMLNKIRESNYIHYFFAIFAIAPFLNIGIILLNVCVLNMYKLTWQIVGFSTAIIVFSVFGVISISVLACHNRKKFDNWNTLACILYGVGVFSVVLALQLLSFHGTFILLAFTFSPLLTVSFTVIYISALFSLLGVLGTVIKVVCKWYRDEDEIKKKICHYVFQIITDMFSFLCVLSFDALFIILMRYRVRHNHFGISSFFGALLPTAVVALIGFGGGKLIGFAQDKSLASTGGGDSEVYCNPAVEPTHIPLTAETTALQSQLLSPGQQSLPQMQIHGVATNPTTKSPAQVEPSSSSSAAAVAMDEPARSVSMTATGNKPQAPESSCQK